MGTFSRTTLRLVYLTALIWVHAPVFAQPTVNITLDDGALAEATLDGGGFTVTRSNNGAVDQVLNVWMERSGTATFNSDYSQSGLLLWSGNTYYIQIPAGQLSASATVTPFQDNIMEGDETVTWDLIAPLQSNHGYTLGAPAQVGMTITDDVAEAHITLDDGALAEATLDGGGFTVTRSNNGAVDQVLNVWMERSGTATFNSDYSQSGLLLWSGNTYYIQIPAGQLSASATVTPIFDEIEEGNETVIWDLIAPLQSNHYYTLGAPMQVEMTIADFVDLLFKDGFED